MLRRDLVVVLGAWITWIAAAAAALLIGHGFVLAVDLYSAASRSVEAHTLLAGEFDPLLGIVRPTLGGLTLALSLFGPIIGARALAMEKERRTFHTALLRTGSAWRLVGRKWLAALTAVSLPVSAAAILVGLWRIVGGHVVMGETAIALGSHLLYAALFTSVGVAAAAFARGVSQATTAALLAVAITWAIDASDGFSALAWLVGAATWSPTTYLSSFEQGTLSLGSIGWFLGMTAGALAIAWAGCRFDLHGVRRLGATVGAIAILVATASILRRLPGAWDVTEARRRSLPPAVVHELRAIEGPIQVVVNLDREDSRRRLIESDAIAKLRLARPDIDVRFPPDELGTPSAPAEDQRDDQYGRLTMRVGARSAVTTSNSRREIVGALLGLTGHPSPDWSQAQYPGYPLVIAGGKRTLILAASYVGVPLLFLVAGLAMTRNTPRRRTT
ncbi:MAG: gliding motility-associated transport system permease protein [Myxococcales bacterium]|jgi:hypothetical protein|nr:gliding motility-associated transport system permease protein [Myxococcales bacterium]